MIDAFAPLTNTTLTLVGSGPLKESLAQRIKDEGLAHIRLSGFIPRDELAQVYRQAQAVVLPSEWYENAPVVILEAFANGTPVVGSAMGGIPETVQDQVTGLTFAAGDPEELRDCIERLINEPDLGPRLGQRAYQFLSSELTPANHIQQLVSLYDDVLQISALVTTF